METHPRNPTVKKYLTGPYGSHYPRSNWTATFDKYVDDILEGNEKRGENPSARRKWFDP